MSTETDRLKEKERPLWQGLVTGVCFFTIFLLLEGLLVWTLIGRHYWLAAPIIFVIAHLMHAHLIAFHEAAHGTLCPNSTLNDAFGRFVGFCGLMSLSLYRTAHHFHHTYLATERDEEFWPFVIPGSSIWLRRTAAFCELFLGLFYTPFLFLRTFLRRGSPIRNRFVRRRIWFDLSCVGIGWVVVLGLIAWFGVWYWFVTLYLAPALLAGFMQSLRKYVEHMGLEGSTVLGSTRSVISPGILGRLLSFSLFNEPYHGVHHRYASLPQVVYPEFADVLVPTAPEETAPYANYRQALWHMLKSLPDPRVGAQWQRAASVETTAVATPRQHLEGFAGRLAVR
jgi:fatty acid desaturase